MFRSLGLAFALVGCADKVTDESLVVDDSTPGETDGDQDGYLAEDDCDDSNAAINSGAAELCDGVDNNCDGTVDEASAQDASTWYEDSDGDGFGLTESSSTACTQPTGYAEQAGDCNDSDTDIYPGASELECTDPTDYNCDGSVGYADNDGDGFAACEECDDSDASRNPSATEVCDTIDNNCDGAADEGVTSIFYQDLDADGYGDADYSVAACEAPAGYSADSSDCDDQVAEINPAATEVCNSADDDCDGLADDADDSLDLSTASTYYTDGDGDGRGDTTRSTVSCAQPSGTVTDGTDCDDSNPNVSPDLSEVCDDLDNNCDASVDNGASDASIWYQDGDGDGFGDSGSTLSSCDQPSGYVASSSDCDDSSSAVSPSATELCNNVDDDCDGTVDGSGSSDAKTYYADTDGDGYGDSSSSTVSCTRPSGYVGNKKDCNDSDATIYTGATEYCDSVDNNCDGTIDEATASGAGTWYKDADSDGYGVSTSTTVACTPPTGYSSLSTDCNDSNNTIYPSASELCDSLDNDCDGTTDDGVLGLSAACPADDCDEIYDTTGTTTDGTYYTDKGAYTCLMSKYGGGWTKVKDNAPVYGTTYSTSYYNSEGFSWNEVLFQYDSGSVSAHCTYPGSMTSCNNLGFQFASESWGVPLNWGSSICGMSTTSYTSATTYVGGYDFKVSRTLSTATIRLGALEGISSCTTSDNSGTAYVDIYVRN